MSAVSSLAATALRIVALVLIGYTAYTIRLNAIHEYGAVIHEFDPWFNYRATVYLEANGADKFFHWFDYESWWGLERAPPRSSLPPCSMAFLPASLPLFVVEPPNPNSQQRNQVP